MAFSAIDIAGYRAMWLMVFFDLPVDSKEARKFYTTFRKSLLKEGFTMLQYSVYARYFPTEDATRSIRRRINEVLPPEGQVRFMMVTDKQFGKMEVHYGKIRGKPEPREEQFELF